MGHVHDPQLETVFTKRQADPSLLDERLLLDALLKGAGTPFELLDSEFNIIRVNEAYAAAHDQPEAFFRGKNHFDVYPTDSRSVFEKVLATGEPAQIAARPHNLPGRSEPETSYWDCTLAPIVNPRNQEQLLVLTETDVTNRVRTEKTLFRASKILGAIQHAQDTYGPSDAPSELLDKLLTEVMGLTESDYGLIGQVTSGEDAQAFLNIQTIINFTRNARSRGLSVTQEPCRLDLADPESLFGAVLLSDRARLSDDPVGEGLVDGLPENCPAIQSLMAIPFSAGGKLTGVICVANAPDGYSPFLLDSLRPLLNCYEQLIRSAVIESEMREALTTLEQNRHVVRDLAVPAVENEHSELIGLINQCYEEILAGAEVETVREVLQSIETRITEHFRHEEDLMLSADYPDFHAHRESHERLLETLRQNIQRFEQDPDYGTEILQKTLAGWFGRHFSTHDQRFNSFLDG